MKKYIKPTFEFVQLSIDERLAFITSPNNGYPPFLPWNPWSFYKKLVWDWFWGWHWVYVKPTKESKSSKQKKSRL